MKKSLFIFIAVLIVIPLQAQNNIITYTANAKLEECTFVGSSGLHVNAFGVPMVSHTFSNSIGTLIFSSAVTIIGDSAFYFCSRLTSVTIPESVTSIGISAFEHCIGLTSITIPKNVTSIGDRAFHDCRGLISIVVTSGNTIYDSRNNCNAIIETASNELIVGCKNTIIPNSVTSIGDYAFHGCLDLTSITIPKGVTSIGRHAFYNCLDLTSITIPEGVTSIGNQAFAGCSSLTSITIPESVTNIEDFAFYHCSSLAAITIPKGVTSIGHQAFIHCSGLVSIVVESGNTKYDSRNNCNAIIETASNELLVGCKNTIIPNSVTSIVHSAFAYCADLISITIPESVTSIGEYAFEDCIGLTSITIPESVTSIGFSAFAYCSGLTSITIPESVTSIGFLAFAYCSGLTSLSCLSLTPPSLGSDVFASVPHDIPLYVHASAIPAYEAADQWNEFDIQPLLVEIDSVSPDTTDLTWLPVDTAALYQLHIYSNQIALDTTLTILANPNNGGTSLQTTASPYRQHRIVLDDEVGTLVVVVFDDNSGATPAQPYRVTISTTSSDMIDIRYDMQVYDITNKIIHQESGLFTLNKKNSLFDALEEVSVSSFSSPSCFDLHGRRYSIEDWHSLPAGIYILHEGGETKKMIKQ